jgi:hypothetical protein
MNWHRMRFTGEVILFRRFGAFLGSTIRMLIGLIIEYVLCMCFICATLRSSQELGYVTGHWSYIVYHY